MTISAKDNWKIYHGDKKEWPPAPPWRQYSGFPAAGQDYPVDAAPHFPFVASNDEIEMVNLAIYLRRPLLVTGSPGVGKTSLAYDIAYNLGLGKVLEWPINSRSTLQSGMYHYDAIGRLHTISVERAKGNQDLTENIGNYIRLGPLGTALVPRNRPRVLLIDEFDKSDYDLPNDLLFIFEKGEFEIPELKRLVEKEKSVNVFLHDSDENFPLYQGKVSCREFPIVVITSNEERELPQPFLRRCIRLKVKDPTPDMLYEIVIKHMGNYVETNRTIHRIVEYYVERSKSMPLATDQLLNAIYLLKQGLDLQLDEDRLLNIVLQSLDQTT
jgi:MoxR-like ATPase